jgi:hypothetical protein
MTCNLCNTWSDLSPENSCIENMHEHKTNISNLPMINYFVIDNKPYTCMHTIYKISVSEFFKTDFDDFKIIQLYNNSSYLYLFPFRILSNNCHYQINIHTNEEIYKIINNENNNNIPIFFLNE